MAPKGGEELRGASRGWPPGPGEAAGLAPAVQVRGAPRRGAAGCVGKAGQNIDHAPEITKMKIHWRMPLKIRWKMPLKILWTSDNPLEHAAEK